MKFYNVDAKKVEVKPPKRPEVTRPEHLEARDKFYKALNSCEKTVNAAVICNGWIWAASFLELEGFFDSWMSLFDSFKAFAVNSSRKRLQKWLDGRL